MALVGELTIAIKAATADLTAGLNKSISSLKWFQGSLFGLQVAGKVFSEITRLAERAAEAIYHFVREQMKAIGDTSKMAFSLGMSSEAFVGFQEAAEAAGMDAEQVGRITAKMRDTIAEALGGSSSAIKAFASLGMGADQIANLGNVSGSEQMMQIADAFRQMGVNVQTTSAVMAIFGSRVGPQMIQFLSQGRQGLQGFIADARESGLAFSEIAGAKVEAANRALKDIGDVFTAVGRAIAIELAPYVKALGDWFLDLVKKTDFFKTVLPQAFSVAGTVIGAIGNAFQLFGGIVSKVFHGIVLGVGLVAEQLFKFLETLASVETLLPESMQLGISDAVSGMRQDITDTVNAADKGFREAGTGEWFSDTLAKWGQGVRDAADAAAKGVIDARAQMSGTMPIVPLEAAKGAKGRDLTPAAMTYNSMEAAKAILAARRAEGDPMQKIATQQLSVLQKVQQGIDKLVAKPVLEVAPAEGMGD